MRARSRAGVAVMSALNSSTVPDVGGCSPEIRLNSVVLPAPFGPRIARRSPGRISRSTSLTAWTPPKRRPTPRKRRIGAAASVVWATSATWAPSGSADFLGVAHPLGLTSLHALRVLAVRRRGVRAEQATELLVCVRDHPDRLGVRDLVPVEVRHDPLHVVVADCAAVLVERDVAV